MSKENETLDKQQKSNDFITDVTHHFSKEDLWDAWWASAIKTISFSGVDKDYERRCFEKFYEVAKKESTKDIEQLIRQEEKAYEHWLSEYEDDISILFAESEADRELCFDVEKENEKLYEMFHAYVNKFLKLIGRVSYL